MDNVWLSSLKRVVVTFPRYTQDWRTAADKTNCCWLPRMQRPLCSGRSGRLTGAIWSIRRSPDRGASVWAVPTSGDHKTFSIIKPESPQATIVNDRLSPDGRWLAYSATDSGRQELYVTAFPSGKGRWQRSQEGAGSPPVWRADGKELYYLGSDGILHAAVVNTKGNEFEVENSRALFAIRFASISCPFDVSPDGQRFLFAVPPEIPSSPMVLVLNWDMELKR